MRATPWLRRGSSEGSDEFATRFVCETIVTRARLRTIHVASAAVLRPRTIHVASAAVPRPIHGRSTWHPRRCRDPSTDAPRLDGRAPRSRRGKRRRDRRSGNNRVVLPARRRQRSLRRCGLAGRGRDAPVGRRARDRAATERKACSLVPCPSRGRRQQSNAAKSIKDGVRAWSRQQSRLCRVLPRDDASSLDV